MNKFFRYISLYIFLFFMISPLSPDSRELVISSLDFPPLTDRTKEDFGFISDLFNAIFESYGYAVEIRVFPWARSFEMSKQGDPVIGIFPSIYNEERERWFYFSEPIFSSAYVLLTREDTGIKTFDSLYDFQGNTIGILRGGITGSPIDGPDFRKEEATDFETNIRKLLAGRFDLITGEYLSIINNIDTNFADDKDSLVLITPHVSKVDFHLMISRNARQAELLLAQCNEGIERIKREGILQDLLAEYDIKTFQD